jgi:uncharacterized membrane protein YkvA (DUF1232 family)
MGKRDVLGRIKQKAAFLKKEINALYLACRHAGTPFYAKLFAFMVVGYALSPIDLIPDFIPVLGYLDDLVLLPIGIWLAVKLIPDEVLAECRLQAEREPPSAKRSIAAGIVIVSIWFVCLYLFGRALVHDKEG